VESTQRDVLFHIFNHGNDSMRLDALTQAHNSPYSPDSSKADFLALANHAVILGNIKTNNEIKKGILDRCLTLVGSKHYDTKQAILIDAINSGDETMGLYAIEQIKKLERSERIKFLKKIIAAPSIRRALQQAVEPHNNGSLGV
jgi:hypothetical protein